MLLTAVTLWAKLGNTLIDGHNWFFLEEDAFYIGLVGNGIIPKWLLMVINPVVFFLAVAALYGVCMLIQAKTKKSPPPLAFDKLSLDDIADHIGISKFSLSREFKKLTGNTVVSFINILRCSEAKRLMEKGMSVSSAAYACGFENLFLLFPNLSKDHRCPTILLCA